MSRCSGQWLGGRGALEGFSEGGFHFNLLAGKFTPRFQQFRMRDGDPAFAAIQLILAIGSLGSEFDNGSLQAVLGTREPFVRLIQNHALALESTLTFLQLQLTPVEFGSTARDVGMRFRSVVEVSPLAGDCGPFGGQ